MVPLIALDSVSVLFRSLRALDSVSLSIMPGETLGLVGESGSGKSTLGHVVAALQPPTSGALMCHVADPRRRIQLILQDPFAALDPRMSVAAIIAEPLRIHRIGTRAEQAARVGELIDLVGLPRDALDRYPHEFSGGQRQRIAIARALAPEPSLIIADEPLSALDVSIQSQVLNLLQTIRQARPVAMLFISHDLAVVHHIAGRVAVLYLGRLMEVATRDALFAQPAHPYTAALLDAVPRIGRRRMRGRAIRGEMPSPLSPPSGCVFHPRCPKAQAICRDKVPALAAIRSGQTAACHFPQ